MATPTEQNESSALGDTARRILMAAETLFAERGFDGVSMNAIAECAGVSKANVFHHFTSKDALYLAVLKECARHQADMLTNLTQEQQPVAQRLRTFARAHLAAIFERKQMSRLMQREMLRDDPHRGQELAQRIFGENFSRFIETIRRGQEQGELRPNLDPAMIAVLIVAADVFFFESQHILRHLPGVTFGDKPEEYSAKVVDLLLHGILNAPEARS